VTGFGAVCGVLGAPGVPVASVVATDWGDMGVAFIARNSSSVAGRVSSNSTTGTTAAGRCPFCGVAFKGTQVTVRNQI